MAKKTRRARPNAHVAATSIAQSEPTLSSIPEIHPVAAIMPGITNLVAYHAANDMTILEGSDGSDNKVSIPSPTSVGAFLESVEAIADTPTLESQSLKEISPLIVPHLIWRASVSPPNSLPVSFDCLLDNGSHLVLIRESLVTELGLRRKKLKTPIKTDLAMHLNEKDNSVTFHDFVKLSLYDVSGEYRAKPVHTVVASNLCCPVLLGLPFLSHNNLTIDHSN